MVSDLPTAGRVRLSDDDYSRAEQMLAPHRARHVPSVVPVWRDDGRFTYVLDGRTSRPSYGT